LKSAFDLEVEVYSASQHFHSLNSIGYEEYEDDQVPQESVQKYQNILDSLKNERWEQVEAG
jgi:hypothetical protein